MRRVNVVISYEYYTGVWNITTLAADMNSLVVIDRVDKVEFFVDLPKKLEQIYQEIGKEYQINYSFVENREGEVTRYVHDNEGNRKEDYYPQKLFSVSDTIDKIRINE